jgi:hypothetical protein
LKTARKQCAKKQHRWTLDAGWRCSLCGARRTRLPRAAALVPLRFGQVYCELCRVNIHAGQPVGLWTVAAGKQSRPAAYCAGCHHENVRRGKALR